VKKRKHDTAIGEGDRVESAAATLGRTRTEIPL